MGSTVTCFSATAQSTRYPFDLPLAGNSGIRANDKQNETNKMRCPVRPRGHNIHALQMSEYACYVHQKHFLSCKHDFRNLLEITWPFLEAKCSGVSALLFSASMSAPTSTSSPATPGEFPSAARWSGVPPVLSRPSMLAPACISSAATLGPLLLAAQCRGVRPVVVVDDTSAPASISGAAAAALSQVEASWRAVPPPKRRQQALGSAPFSKRMRTRAAVIGVGGMSERSRSS